MGCCGSTSDPRDKEVQKELNTARRSDDEEFKLLLLGAGGSGKSTLFKQLEYIHGEGFPKKRRMFFRKQIHEQMVDSMRLLITACHEYNQREPDQYEPLYEYDAKTDTDDIDEAGSAATTTSSATDSDIKISALALLKKRDNAMSAEVVVHLKRLWGNEVIQKMFEVRNEICVPDSTRYFMDEMDRVTAADYVPVDKDLILVRYRTTGMLEKKFEIQDHRFKICDVGGQRSERRKWMNFFDNVTAVIFVVALSSYDELTFEEETNATETSIEVFDQQVNSQWFSETPFILFLNKSDLFYEKIKTVPIKVCEAFSGYEGADHDEAASLQHIRSTLNAVNQNEKRSLFTHTTNATNKDNIQKVFHDVQTMIINWALERAGLT